MEMICLPGRLESGERDFTVSDWLKIGCRAGQGRAQVGLGITRDCPEEVSLAVTAGILSAGADCWQYGVLSLPEFRCCVGISAPSLALMLLPPRRARVMSALGDALFPLKRPNTRNSGKGKNIPMETLRAMYPIHLLRTGCDFSGKAARFTGPMSSVLEEVFCQLGGQVGGDITVQLWGEEGRLSLFRRQMLVWDGTAPDDDGPAQALRLLADVFGKEDFALEKYDSEREKALSQNVHVSSP